MKEYTDGILTIRVGRKYAHIIDDDGSETGQMSKDYFFRHAKDAGFTPVEDYDEPRTA